MRLILKTSTFTALPLPNAKTLQFKKNKFAWNNDSNFYIETNNITLSYPKCSKQKYQNKELFSHNEIRRGQKDIELVNKQIKKINYMYMQNKTKEIRYTGDKSCK